MGTGLPEEESLAQVSSLLETHGLIDSHVTSLLASEDGTKSVEVAKIRVEKAYETEGVHTEETLVRPLTHPPIHPPTHPPTPQPLMQTTFFSSTQSTQPTHPPTQPTNNYRWTSATSNTKATLRKAPQRKSRLSSPPTQVRPAHPPTHPPNP